MRQLRKNRGRIAELTPLYRPKVALLTATFVFLGGEIPRTPDCDCLTSIEANVFVGGYGS